MKVSSFVMVTGLLFMAAPEFASASQDDYVRGFKAGAQFADALGWSNHMKRVNNPENSKIYEDAAIKAYNEERPQ